MLTKKDITTIHNILQFYNTYKELPNIAELARFSGTYREYFMYNFNKMFEEQILVATSDDDIPYLVYFELFEKLKAKSRKSLAFKLNTIGKTLKVHSSHNVDMVVPDEIDFTKQKLKYFKDGVPANPISYAQ